MFSVPAHKQTDPAKLPGCVRPTSDDVTSKSVVKRLKIQKADVTTSDEESTDTPETKHAEPWGC
jgi:hypothetical protein